MAKRAQPKAAAVLTVRDAPRMTPGGRRRVANWLRKQADTIAIAGSQLSDRYTARYLYADALERHSTIVRRR